MKLCRHRVDHGADWWCFRLGCEVPRDGLHCRRCEASGGAVVTAADWRGLSEAERQGLIERMRRDGP